MMERIDLDTIGAKDPSQPRCRSKVDVMCQVISSMLPYLVIHSWKHRGKILIQAPSKSDRHQLHAPAYAQDRHVPLERRPNQSQLKLIKQPVHRSKLWRRTLPITSRVDVHPTWKVKPIHGVKEALYVGTTLHRRSKHGNAATRGDALRVRRS
jgi:hypothetical protein